MKRSFLPAIAMAMSLTVPAQALDLGEMTSSEREAFRAEIRAYLLDNPEVIFEAVAVLEERQAEEEAKGDIDLVRANADALFNDGHSWVGGNPDGDITLVEFLDYRCGYCRRAFADVTQLVATDGNIRFVVKEFPILGEQSTLSSRFAIATQQIAGDDAYKAVHDGLMSFNGDLNETTLRRLAGSMGYDADAIIAHMDSDQVSQVITANRELGTAMKISGTPSFIMSDQVLRGYVPLDGMRQIVQDIRTQ